MSNISKTIDATPMQHQKSAIKFEDKAYFSTQQKRTKTMFAKELNLNTSNKSLNYKT